MSLFLELYYALNLPHQGFDEEEVVFTFTSDFGVSYGCYRLISPKYVIRPRGHRQGWWAFQAHGVMDQGSCKADYLNSKGTGGGLCFGKMAVKVWVYQPLLL